MILLDPETGEPLGPIDGSDPPKFYNPVSEWAIERDESGMPVRMRWMGPLDEVGHQ